jgi:hypothetical protein
MAWGMKCKGRIYELEVGPPAFEFIGDKVTKRVAMIISRPTQFPNIWFYRYVTLGFRWPWLRNIACFRDIDEPMEVESEADENA